MSKNKVEESFNFDGKEPLCLVPFVEMILSPDGKVWPCCFLGDQFPIGDVNKNTIKEIWNAPKYQQLRRELISGKPNICKEKIEKLSCNKIYNQIYSNLLANKHLKFDVESAASQSNPAQRLELMLNPKCNLQCHMCTIWQLPSGIYNENNFWSEAEENILPYVHSISLKGGEPLIVPETFKLMDMTLKSNPNCAYDIVTNGHYKVGKKLRYYLENINISHLTISIDSLNKENFKKIRYPGKLELVLDTLNTIKEIRDKRKKDNQFSIECNFVLQKDNYYELGEFLDFSKENNVIPIVILLVRPYTKSILDFDRSKKLRLIFELQELIEKHFYIKSLRIVYNSLVNSLKKPTDPISAINAPQMMGGQEIDLQL